MKTRMLSAFAALSTFIVQPSSLDAQGSLTPPGPPAQTMKTLAQVEPRIPISSVVNINAPGSYYLTANISEFAASFITISNSNVTLDLNGFYIFQGDTGLYVAPGLHNVAIRNGFFDSPGVNGVYSASPVVLEKISVANCSFGFGVRLSSNSIVKDCTFTGNAGNGLQIGDDATLVNVTSISNGAAGILTGNAANMENCVATGNATYGINVGNGSVLSDCVTRNNGSANILATNDFMISHCTANGSRTGSGISFNYTGTVIGCTTDENNQYGIDAGQRGNVVDCNANANGQSGIRINYIGNVQRCVCDGNGFCGIISDAGGLTIIMNNMCSENGTSGANNGAGIRVLNASGHRIEANNVALNYRGIDVQSVRNIIFRNTAISNSNTNYNIVAGNSFGPIVNVAAVGDISGTANANHPAANFSY